MLSHLSQPPPFKGSRRFPRAFPKSLSLCPLDSKVRVVLMFIFPSSRLLLPALAVFSAAVVFAVITNHPYSSYCLLNRTNVQQIRPVLCLNDIFRASYADFKNDAYWNKKIRLSVRFSIRNWVVDLGSEKLQARLVVPLMISRINKTLLTVNSRNRNKAANG
jgi:hypothetical protein